MNEIRQIELVKKSYEELQEMVIQLTTDKFILQSKIDKAIEYIKIQQKIFKDYDIVSENQLNNLLNILKEAENVENN